MFSLDCVLFEASPTLVSFFLEANNFFIFFCLQRIRRHEKLSLTFCMEGGLSLRLQMFCYSLVRSKVDAEQDNSRSETVYV